jgi:hypothetical protein
MKHYISPIIRIATAGVLLYIVYHQNIQIRSLTSQGRSVQYICDSLEAELSARDMQMSRYQIILDRADEELNSECKEQLEEITKNVE